MAGLLDFLGGMDKKTQMGLLMAGANMMQTQRGDSPFAAVGNGLLGYAQGLLEQEKQARDDARESKKDERQTRLDDVDMQMKQAQIQHYQNAPVGGDPYWTTIDTPQGLMKFNARTGEALPVQLEGKPLMKSSSDVALQSALEAGKTGAKTQNSVVEIDNPDGSKTKTLGGTAFPNLIPPRQTDLSTLPQRNGQSTADNLLAGLIKTESSGNPNAVSPKGAIGLTQIMPETGRNPGYGVQPLQNDSPEENMRFGRDYLDAMIKANGGDVQKGLSAYNQGQGNLQKNGINNQGYVDSVIGNSIDLQNPLTKPTIAGMQLAAKSGVSPKTAIDEGVKIAEKSVSDLKAVQSAGREMYTGQTQEDKLKAETEAKRQQAENEAAIKLRTEPKITAQNKSAETNEKFNAEHRQDNESGKVMVQRIDELMKYLYPDGKPVYDKNGDLLPPEQKMIFDNAPFDRAKFLAHNKGFGTFEQGSNLNSLIKAAKQVTLDNLNGKLGAGIATADLNFINDLTGINEDNLKPAPDIYRSVGQWRKNAVQKMNKGQAESVNDLVGKYLK